MNNPVSEPRQSTVAEDATEIIGARRTIIDFFQNAVDANADRTALVYFDRSFSWREIDALSDALATHLEQRGVKPAERVAIQLQNTPQFLITMLAVWKIRASFVTISPMYRAQETSRILQDSGACALITHPEVWERNGEASTNETSVRFLYTTDFRDFGSVVPEHHLDEPVIETPEGASDLRAAIEEHLGESPVSSSPTSEDLALIAYTSGSTGVPKGTITRHNNLAFASETWPESQGFNRADEVILGVAPFVHMTGIAAAIGSWLSTAAKLVVMYRFEADHALELMERHRVTWLVGAATIYTAMLNAKSLSQRDLSALRAFACGGAPIPAELVGRIERALDAMMRPGYGMTESTAATTGYPADAPLVFDGEGGIVAVGRAMPGVSLKVIDEEGRAVEPGTPGELLIQGPGVVEGYWNRPEDNETTFRDGWLHSGDIAFIDIDGWVYIIDRTKNMIIASGYNVWPREIEEVLHKFPGVREAAVVGVHDDYRGQTVKAYISTVEGETVDLDEISTYCRANLAAYKAPRLFEILDEIPKNQNGKIDYPTIRKIDT